MLIFDIGGYIPVAIPRSYIKKVFSLILSLEVFDAFCVLRFKSIALSRLFDKRS